MAVVNFVEHELWPAQFVIDGVRRVGRHGAIDEPNAHEHGDGDASRAVGGIEVAELLPLFIERTVTDADGAPFYGAGEVAEVRYTAERCLDVRAERRKEHAETAAVACAGVADARPVDGGLLDGEVDKPAAAEDAGIEVEIARCLVDVLEDEAFEVVLLEPLGVMLLAVAGGGPVRRQMDEQCRRCGRRAAGERGDG